MRPRLPPLAHAGESHRRDGGGAAPAAPAGGGPDASTPPVAVPAAAGGTVIAPDLVIGLLVLSGWLWLPLLRRAARGPLRRRASQKAK